MIDEHFKVTIATELKDSLLNVDNNKISEIASEIKEANHIFLTGAGRAGLMMRAMAMRLAQMGLKISFVGDITTLAIKEQDLLIVGSGKAQTMTSTYFSNRAKENQAKVILITANPLGEIAKIADIVLTIIAPLGMAETRQANKSVQIMGNRFEQSLLLVADLIVMESMQQMNIDEVFMRSMHANLE